MLNINFLKGYFCTDLYPNTLYRKCIKVAPKKGGGGSSAPPLPTPLYVAYTVISFCFTRFNLQEGCLIPRVNSLFCMNIRP